MFILALSIAMATDVQPLNEPIGLQFDNGLRVVLQRAPQSRTVVSVARFNQGWSTEPTDQHGVTHLLEHMWFRSGGVGDADVWTTLRSHGCQIEAWTGPDHTRFITSCPETELDLLLGLEMRRLSDPLAGVNETHLALERAIIAHEERGREDANKALSRVVFEQLVPPEATIHKRLAPGIQTSSEIELGDVTAHAPLAFSPDAGTLVIAGPIEVDEVQSLLEQALGASRPLEARERDQAGYQGTSADAIDLNLRRETLRLATPRLAMAWNVDPALGESSAMEVFADQMGRALASEVMDRGGFRGAGCGIYEDEDTPALICTIDFDPETTEPEGYRWVQNGLDKAFSGKGLAAMRKAVKTKKTQLPQDIVRSLSDPSRNAQRLASEVARTGTLRSTEEVVEGIRDWDPNPVFRAARRWYRVGNAAKIWIEPGSPAALEVGEPQLPETLPSTMPSTPARPPMAWTDRPSALRELDNGLTVVTVQRPESASIVASLRVPGGAGQKPFPLAVFSERFSGAPGVRETQEIHTGEILHNDSAEVYAVGPADQPRKTLAAAHAMVALRVPFFNAEHRDHVQRWVHNGRTALAVNADRPEFIANALLRDHVSPGHRPSRGLTIADFDALEYVSAASVMAHLVQRYTPLKSLLVVTGPQTPEALMDEAERQFEDWHAAVGVAPIGPRLTEAASKPSAGKYQISDPSLNTTTLRFECPMPKRQDDAARRLITTAVDDVLWRGLRETTGLTYTPGAFLSDWPDGTSVLSVWVDTGPREGAKTHRAADALIAGLANTYLAQGDRYRDQTLRALHTQATSLSGTETLVFATHRDGGDPTRPLAHVSGRLNAIDPEEVAQDLALCIIQGTWVIYGPSPTAIEGFEDIAVSTP